MSPPTTHSYRIYYDLKIVVPKSPDFCLEIFIVDVNMIKYRSKRFQRTRLLMSKILLLVLSAASMDGHYGQRLSKKGIK
jgi:hypothetical protein